MWNFLLNTLRNGMREIIASLGRSMLTMLGVILGVVSLSLSMSVVEGTFSRWEDMLNARGGLTRANVRADQAPESQSAFLHRSRGMRLDDFQSLEKNLPRYSQGHARINRNFILRYDVKKIWQPVNGITPSYFDVERRKLEQGRLLSQWDIDNASPVAVIGSTVRNEFFGNDLKPIGKKISVARKSFTVVGILEEYNISKTSKGKKRKRGRGARYTRWMNDGIFIPISSYLRRIEDSNIQEFSLETSDPELLEDFVQSAGNILGVLHGGVLDFDIQTNLEAMERLNETKQLYKIVLGVIASVALIISAVGIMNVMLASINERFREIGVRKAVGATRAHIFGQFLVESSFLSSLGGVIGILASVLLGNALNYALEFEEFAVKISAQNLLLGFFFSSGVGLLAGVYPSIRASLLDPINALRYE